MPLVCGVKFRGTGKIYFFSPGHLEDLAVGDSVIVETARGKEIGEIRQEIHQVSDGEIVGNLKSVVRMATKHDLVIADRYHQREVEALEQCEREVAKSGLDMKIVGAEYNFDGSRLTFFFTSDHRVDFRELVRDLARVFRTRIDLRQIGVRDQAKIIGGIGKCGRELCCSTWMQEFCPVSIRMAKMQNLPLTPLEISGLCGRLLCCLNYENESYREVRALFPKVGKYIETSVGTARVRAVNIVKELAEIEFENGTRLQANLAQLRGEEPIELPTERGSVSAVQKALDVMSRESKRGKEEEVPPSGGNQPTERSRQSQSNRKRRSSSAKGKTIEVRETSSSSGKATGNKTSRRRRRRPSQSARQNASKRESAGNSGQGRS